MKKCLIILTLGLTIALTACSNTVSNDAGSGKLTEGTKETTITETYPDDRAVELMYTDEKKLYQEAAERFDTIPVYAGDRSFVDGKLSGNVLTVNYDGIVFKAYLKGNAKESSWNEIGTPSDSIRLRQSGDTYAMVSDGDVVYSITGTNKEAVIEAFSEVVVKRQ